MDNIYVNHKTSFDEYSQNGLTFDFHKPLSDFQKRFILLTIPNAEIIGAEYVRREWLPCPIRVKLRVNGEVNTVYLKIDRHVGGVRAEAYVLPLLANMGLNVPKLLAGPVIDDAQSNLGEMTIISEIKGDSILDRYYNSTGAELETAKQLIIKGVDILHRLTLKLIDAGANRILPCITMKEELNAIIHRGGAWFHHPLFTAAVSKLETILEDISEPLVFSNGDINPGNFLCNDDTLTGFIDFTHSSFKDPLYGFATYITYDAAPFNHARIVNDYLKHMNRPYNDFIPRLMLRSLWTLQREVSVDGNEDREYRERLLGYL